MKKNLDPHPLTLRLTDSMKQAIQKRAAFNGRKVSSEIRHLLTYARNSVDDEAPIPATLETGQTTSVVLTHGLREWINVRTMVHDRSAQIEVVSLIQYALDDITRRELALLEGLTQAP